MKRLTDEQLLKLREIAAQNFPLVTVETDALRVLLVERDVLREVLTTLVDMKVLLAERNLLREALTTLVDMHPEQGGLPVGSLGMKIAKAALESGAT